LASGRSATVGRDPFGDPVRPPIDPNRIVQRLGELGAYGVNLHDNDLVPRGACVVRLHRRPHSRVAVFGVALLLVAAHVVVIFRLTSVMRR